MKWLKGMGNIHENMGNIHENMGKRTCLWITIPLKSIC